MPKQIPKDSYDEDHMLRGTTWPFFGPYYFPFYILELLSSECLYLQLIGE